MASPETNLAAVHAAQEASAVEYLRRTGHREATVLARVIAERDALRVLASPVPASDALLSELEGLLASIEPLPWALGLPTENKIVIGASTGICKVFDHHANHKNAAANAAYIIAVCNAAPALLALVRLAEAATNQAEGELRGAFLALSHITPEHVTPEWRARMKAIYLEKGGEQV